MRSIPRKQRLEYGSYCKGFRPPRPVVACDGASGPLQWFLMGQEQQLPPDATVQRASRVRYGVLGFLCALSFLLYLDRVCIGKAASFIQNDLGLTDSDMSWIFWIFTVAYCVFELPTGHWGDRYGSRGVLTRIMVWWSIFTALTGVAWGFWSMMTMRFLFGAGEAGGLPNAARVVRRWFPIASRGRIQGWVTTASLVGGAAAPWLAAYLIEAVGWRKMFFLFGLLGIVLAVFFYLWYRDDPALHPGVNAQELELLGAEAAAAPQDHPAIPWRLVLTSPNVWLMGTVMTCGSFSSYLQLYWYPRYLESGFGVDNITAGKYSSMVLYGGAVGCVVGGFLHDWVLRLTGDRRWSRSGIGGSVFFLAALAELAILYCDSPFAVSVCMTLACFAGHCHVAAWWGVTTDITGKHLGALFGLMNSLGFFGGGASQLFFGHFADYRKSLGYSGRAAWDPALYVYVVVLIVGAFCWLMVDARKSAVEPAPPRAS